MIDNAQFEFMIVDAFADVAIAAMNEGRKEITSADVFTALQKVAFELLGEHAEHYVSAFMSVDIELHVFGLPGQEWPYVHVYMDTAKKAFAFGYWEKEG